MPERGNLERMDVVRKAIAAILTGLSLAVPAAAWAEPANSAGPNSDPFKLSGAISVKYERDAADGPPTQGTMYTFRLNGELDIGSGWSLYGRLGAQYATEPQVADFNPAAYGENQKLAVAIDQFGITYKRDKMVYKLGRQEVTIGTTALLYNHDETKIGKNVFVDGVSASGTAGAVDLFAIAAQENWDKENKLYAIRAGFNPSQSINCGLTLGRYQYTGGGGTGHWAIDGTYKSGKASLTGEYTQSSRSTDNMGYAVILGYGFTEKLLASITHFRLESEGSMGQQSDFDSGNRGFHYGLAYKLDGASSLEVIYKDQRTISNGAKNSKLEATLTYRF